MSLKPVYNSKEEIPEAIAEHYKENADGTYKLQLDGGLKTQADVDRVKKSLQDEREKNEELTKKLSKIPDDFDPDKWDKVKGIDPDNPPGGESDDLEEERKRLQKEYRELEDELKQKYKDKEEKLQSDAEQAKMKARTFVKDNWKRKMLSEKFGFTDPRRLNAFMLEIKHGNDPEFSQVRRLFETIEVKEEDGTYKVVGGDLKDEQGAYEALERIATDEIAKHYKPADANAGGGAGNEGHQGNGQAKKLLKPNGSLNLTEASKIYSENKEKAKRLVSEAGFDPEKVFRE